MCLVVAAIGASLRPSTSSNAQERPPIKEEKFKYADLSLKEWRVKNDKEDRREIVNSYVKFKKIPESARNDFYNCLSEYSHRKSEELHLDQALDRGVVLPNILIENRKNYTSIKCLIGVTQILPAMQHLFLTV